MTWEELLAELEGDFEVHRGAALAGEIDERRAAELARIRLVDRLRPLVGTGTSIVVGLSSHGIRRATVEALGTDWVLLMAPDGECVVALTQLLWIEGFGASSESVPMTAATAALDLRYALGLVTRDRSTVRVLTVDGATSHGTLDAVGADHVLLAVHDPGEQRRAGAVRAIRAVSLTAIVAVCRA